MAGSRTLKSKDKAPAGRATVQPIRPKRQYRFGRHLAFTIDEDSVQMAAALHLGRKVKLLGVEKAYLSSSQSSETDRSGLLRRAIRPFVDSFGGRRPTISLTLTGPQTALRSIVMPHLKGSELKAALQFEARRQIPFPVEDCWVDHRLTETIQQGDDRQVRASILAATRLAVEEQLAPFQKLGLKVSQVYHTQDVVGQLLRPLPDFDENQRYALIDIHRRSTQISYYRGSELEFYNVSSLGSSFLANRSDPTVFEYFAESLATEIQNSLDYYGGQFSSPLAHEIFIYGDLSYTDELIALLSSRFGFRFRRFPTERLSFVRGKELAFTDNLAVCLPAVAAVTNRAVIANLMPLEFKRQQLLRKADRLGIAAMVLLVGLMMAHWIGQATSLRAAREHLAELERRSSEFRASEMFATYNHLKHKLAANRVFMDKTRENPSYLSLNLKELSHLVPAAARLYNLEYHAGASEREYRLSGLVTTRSTPPELVLAELVENLMASPFFEEVTVERHVKRRKDEEFFLDFSLSMRGIT